MTFGGLMQARDIPGIARDAQLLVVGSTNVDRTFFVERLPQAGETVMAVGSEIAVGGKGANQAIAARTFGVSVRFFSNLGQGSERARAEKYLGSHGIDLIGIDDAGAPPTGSAVVLVDEAGENSIVVDPGANGHYSASSSRIALSRALEDAGKSAVVVTQCEVPSALIEDVASAVAAAGGRLVLNLAPYVPLSRAVISAADPLVVNESEAVALAASLCGSEAASAVDPLELCRQLSKAVKSIVITLGRQGCVYSEHPGSRPRHIPGNKVDRVVDSTGAGDAFVGGLAASLSRGSSFKTAVEVANVFASLTVRTAGASMSYKSAADMLDDRGDIEVGVGIV